jgi:hypothetical protein
MTCTACSSDSNPERAASQLFEAVYLGGLADRLLPSRASRAAEADRLLQSIDIDRVRVVFGGPHGAGMYPVPHRAPPAAPAPLAKALARADVRPAAVAAVWKALAEGACLVRLHAVSGAGVTTLLHALAGGAGEHGFTNAFYVADASGCVADIAQAVALLLDPVRRPRYYTASDREQIVTDRRSFVLLDRANLTVADAAVLCGLLPTVRFVAAGAPAAADPPGIVLGALPSSVVVGLIEERCGRSIDDENLRVALDLCASVGSLPGPCGLIAVAARALRRSFISLSLQYNSGDAVIRALIGGLSAGERHILETLGLARAPLAYHHIGYVLRSAEIGPALEHLAECGLVRFSANVYELPRYVERLLPPPADANALLARIVDVLRDVLISWQAIPVSDAQLTSTEAFLALAAQRSDWSGVLALGPRLADAFAARGAFGAWLRVLDRCEYGATIAGNATARDSARHDLGVRALLTGERSRAQTCLSSAARARLAAGDESGAAASSALLAIANDELLAPSAAALSAPPALSAPSAPSVSSPAPPGELPPAPGLLAGRRPTTARDVLLVGVGILALAIIVFSLRYRPVAAPAINEFSANPVSLSGGRASELCVDAVDATAVEVFPDSVRFPAGKHCLTVQPASTTTYVAVGTAADGRQVRRAVTVKVADLPALAALATQPRISSFTVNPARIKPGQSAHICYAVTGAHELHIVPRVGKLTRLAACQTLTLRTPHRYRYTLSATGDGGQVAVREAHVDVVAATPRRPRAVNRRALNARLIERAVYQFDVTPKVVERGQATSLCVGVGSPARGFVTHVGTLPPGITRCYRIAPSKTTVYRLYVALRDATAVQSVTVAVRPATRKSEAARGERR